MSAPRPAHAPPPGAPAHPEGSLPLARKVASVLTWPIERFLAVEAASGIVLILAAVIAVVWANSPWAGTYHRLLETPVGLSFGDHTARASVHVVVNDVLMAVFFLVVGLEIRRELDRGELADRRKATLPIVAAIGGMLAPAAIFLVLGGGGDGARGWGVPMATDIAFAIGVLTLLGRRVPPALRVLLLALAIIDDLGAIVVIALFYSGGLDVSGLALAAVGIAGLVVLRLAGVRAVSLYLVPGVVVWLGALEAGIHPTIAGVLTGLSIPTRPWAGHEDESPAARLEHGLHAWVAFVIMPVFALASAGVDLGAIDVGAAPGVLVGIVAGLVLGKPLGVLAACALAIRLGVADLPRGVSWAGMTVVGAVAGIGFTMALFIARLAYGAHPELLAIATLAVLISSVVAALLALVLGRVLLPASPPTTEGEPR